MYFHIRPSFKLLQSFVSGSIVFKTNCFPFPAFKLLLKGEGYDKHSYNHTTFLMK